MKRRNLTVGLVVLASGLLLLIGNVGSAAAATATCVVKTQASFVAQGEGAVTATVADVVEVGCDPTVYGTGSKITISDNQLYERCGKDVTWYVPNPFSTTNGPKVELALDADGNGTAAVIAGPNCQAGETLVVAKPFTFGAFHAAGEARDYDLKDVVFNGHHVVELRVVLLRPDGSARHSIDQLRA